MAFIDDIPHWESLSSDDFEMHKISSQLQKGVRILVTNCANQEPDEYCARLKGMLHHFACTIETEVPVGYFSDDIEGEMWRIVNCIDTMPKLADCLDILCNWGLSRDKVNELLEDNNIGYEYIDDKERGTGWFCRDSTVVIVEKLEELIPRVQSFSSQAHEQIKQALQGLKDSKNERARKDVVWSLLSGAEALIKNLAKGNREEISSATQSLQDEGAWGCRDIVKDGSNLFRCLQHNYPDLRHGTTEENASRMSAAEAFYWVERISCYMKYMTNIAKELGRDLES